MSRVQFSLARLMLGVALTAFACFATRFTWGFARWLLLPSLVVLLVAGWGMLLSWGQRKSKSVLVGFTLGGVGGWLLEMFALVLADEGRGTYLPLLAFFSPLYLPELYVAELVPTPVGDIVSTILLIVAPSLFCGYGAALGWAVRNHWGAGCFATIMLFHYGTAAFTLLPAASGIYAPFQNIYGLMPWWVIAATLLFVGLQVATLVFLMGWQRHPQDGRRSVKLSR
jgi:hypothetical protein